MRVSLVASSLHFRPKTAGVGSQQTLGILRDTAGILGALLLRCPNLPTMCRSYLAALDMVARRRAWPERCRPLRHQAVETCHGRLSCWLYGFMAPPHVELQVCCPSSRCHCSRQECHWTQQYTVTLKKSSQFGCHSDPSLTQTRRNRRTQVWRRGGRRNSIGSPHRRPIERWSTDLCRPPDLPRNPPGRNKLLRKSAPNGLRPAFHLGLRILTNRSKLEFETLGPQLIRLLTILVQTGSAH